MKDTNNSGRHDTDNIKQHQDRQSKERKHSGQSGSNAGRNNISPRPGGNSSRQSKSR
ncbi:MAG: hypothetical protein V4603_03690 [Pseudomonadota bacterium]